MAKVPGGVSVSGFRTAFVVAANDASDESKRLARRSGGWVCDGTADNVEIQAAIDALGAYGGVVLLTEGLYNILSTVRLASHVVLEGMGRQITNLRWVGPVTMAMIDSDQTVHLLEAGLRRMTLDAYNVSGVEPVQLWTAQRCDIRNLTITNVTGVGAPALRLETAIAENAYFNRIDDIYIDNASVGLRVRGRWNDSNPFTVNTFSHLVMRNIGEIGINFIDWADNNYFFSTLIQLTENNAVGIVFNSSIPTSDAAVYGNMFYALAVDSYDITGAVGLQFNHSKENTVLGFFHSPEEFNGDLINDNGHALSYLVLNNQLDGAAATGIETLRKGYESHKTGAATVADGDTYVTVTHGLPHTPSINDIKVTPTNDLSNATKFWISSVGATTFRINVDGDPGVGTATFVWSAEVYG